MADAPIPDAGDGETMVAEGDTGMRMPPPTFEFLVHTIFTQALMALGRIPNPITQKSHKNLDTAKHFIATLAMLEQKTAGNLATDEKRLLDETQHQLRMMFMEAK